MICKDVEFLVLVTVKICECVGFTEDMARFVDNYPEYKKMQGNVSKHVTLVTEMSKLVEARKLMLVSQTEQDLACNGGQGAAYEVVNIHLFHLLTVPWGNHMLHSLKNKKLYKSTLKKFLLYNLAFSNFVRCRILISKDHCS